jgi:hypothetical protein
MTTGKGRRIVGRQACERCAVGLHCYGDLVLRFDGFAGTSLLDERARCRCIPCAIYKLGVILGAAA